MKDILAFMKKMMNAKELMIASISGKNIKCETRCYIQLRLKFKGSMIMLIWEVYTITILE